MKLETALVTRMPWRWTSSGSRGVASWSLFWTWTWAMSGLVLASKVRVMVTLPAESLVDDM
jgi:hypothetical protein